MQPRFRQRFTKGKIVTDRDRIIRDHLFDDGFAKMERQQYAEGLEMLRIASGAEHLEVDPHGDYAIETGVYTLSPVSKAAKGLHVEVDPAALVFMGAEAEFRGFIERRTGSSPDYRIPGYANHLGQAIDYYRRAETIGYPVGTERLSALKLRLGSQDFNDAENSHNEAHARWQAHFESSVKETRAAMGLSGPAEVKAKQGGCYIATAVYGSYDCPEVWVLRRWRDSVLAKTGAGRTLIQVYYTTSPKIVRALGTRAWFHESTKYPLNRFVARLRRAGIADSPYED